MPIKIKCPNPTCGKTLSFPDTMAGRSLACPACQHPAQIGRFQIRAQLGAGAFGAVYRAFDPQLEREVALKVPRPETMENAEAKARFQREAKAAAQLHHPNIVPVHEVGQEGDKCFIVSAYIPGHSLASMIPGGGAEPREAVRLAIQLLDALGNAHKQGILHRDVKPANALVTDDGTLFLTDFGLAGWVDKDESRLTHSGAIMGTPAYMPPEQASGETHRVGPASDQYGAAASLYHLLTGQLPFSGPAVQILQEILRQPPPPISKYRADIDPILESICLKALAKEPEERYADCPAFAAALREWLAANSPADCAGMGVVYKPLSSAKPVTAPLPSRTPTLSPPSETALAGRPSQRVVLVAVAIFAGIVLLAIIAGYWLTRPSETTEQSAALPPVLKTTTDRPDSTTDLTQRAPRDTEGFVPAFNGKDLTGWLVDAGEAKEWGVADGEIIGWGKDGKTRSCLLTDRPYADVRLRLEFNLSQGAMAGITLRALRGEKMPLNGQAIVEHPQFKLIDRRRASEETGTIHWVLNTVNVAPSQSADLNPVGSWNRLEVELKGHSIRAWLNDKLIVNATLAADARLADGSLPALNRPKGRLGLKTQIGTVRFRNIEIKELAVAGGTSAAAPAPGNSVAAAIPERDRGKWRVADGFLEQISPSENVWIGFGDKTWKDYDFSAEFIRVHGNDQICLAFLVDVADKNQACLFGLGSYANAAHTIEWWGSGKPPKVHNQQKGSIPNGVWQRARVSVRNGHAQCFLNDQRLFDSRIDTHSTGLVGLRTWHSICRFRNIQVTDPQGKVLFEGLPDLESCWSAK